MKCSPLTLSKGKKKCSFKKTWHKTRVTVLPTQTIRYLLVGKLKITISFPSTLIPKTNFWGGPIFHDIKQIQKKGWRPSSKTSFFKKTYQGSEEAESKDISTKWSSPATTSPEAEEVPWVTDENHNIVGYENQRIFGVAVAWLKGYQTKHRFGHI